MRISSKFLTLTYLIAGILLLPYSAVFGEENTESEDVNPAPGFIERYSSDSNYGTKLEEIVKWEDLSNQYVLGYGLDNSGKLIPFAIYDKTFSTYFFSHFWKLLILGSVGISDLNLAHLNKIINKQKIKKSIKNNLDFHLTPEQREELESTQIHISGDFWKNKNIIWKSGKQPDLLGPSPLRVSFRDFNWSEMAKDHPTVSQALLTFGKSTHYLSKNEGIPLSLEINSVTTYPNVNFPTLSEPTYVDKVIEDIEFDLQADGTYKIHHEEFKKLARPIKVIDLHKKNSSLQRAASWALITMSIKSGLSAIPIYGPPQATMAMLERVFDFIELLYLHRHAQALILVLEALDHNQNSPFTTSKLSEEQLKDAVFYLLRSQTMLSSIFLNLFSKNETLTDKYLHKINTKRAQGLVNLSKKEIELFPIPNTYFALGVKKDLETEEIKKLKIYALGFTKLARRKKPITVVDFLRPHKEKRKRDRLQVLLLSANFIYVPIPTISSIIKLIFKEIVIREYHRRQMWENGYLAHIHHSPNELKELLMRTTGIPEALAEKYEKSAIFSIESKRIDPLDLTSEEIPLHRKQVENWLKFYDPSYQSWSELHTEKSRVSVIKTNNIIHNLE